MSLIVSGVTTALIVATVSTIPLLIKRYSKTDIVRVNDKGEKSVDLFKAVFWIFYPLCIAFIVLGVCVIIFTDEPIAGVGFIVLGAILLTPFIIFQLATTSVDWTSNYIVGAKSGMNLKRHKVLWQDVVEVKYHANHTMEIKDKFGKSVFWSIYHKGWPAIIDDLRRIRPDIDTSDFTD